MKYFLPVLMAFFHLFGFAPFACADPLKWINPILPQRADPHILLHTDGWYYFTATVPEYDRIELRRAKTLGELTSAEAKVIWTKHDRGTMSHHIWAPEIHCIDGKWYLYFAAGRAEAIWDIRMYVLENTSPNPLEGTWTEKGQIKMNWESFTLDATTFELHGTRYLAWAQNEIGKKGTGIYLAKMDTPWSITGKQVVLSQPELPWEKVGFNVNEGPAVIVKNGRIFMTYSASATDANYCLGMLTAAEHADLLNPAVWSKSPEPVFKTDATASQFGPGHNSFTTTPDGKTDILIYHDRNYEKIQGDPLKNHDRATRAQIIHWKSDGTPDFGKPVPDGPYEIAPVSAQTISGTATANYADTRQRIDGFGASSAWDRAWTEEQADLFFSTKGNGIGLSLLRTRIAPDGSTVETGIMKMAQARGATVWSTPWSPPISYKTSNSVNGGDFISSESNYKNYADQLANYVASMKKDHHVEIAALSVQNEPDLATDYESCVWTAEQIHDFVPYLSTALKEQGLSSTKIMLPEDQHGHFTLATATLNDPKTAPQVGILGAHAYGNSVASIKKSLPATTLPLWETEHYWGNDDTITNGLELAREIHDFLTVADASAYHYWWLKKSGAGSLSGNSTDQPAKRFFVMGNYSKFIRPGFYRVGVVNTTPALISAYKDPHSANFVVVAANPTTQTILQTFVLTDFPKVTTVNPWVTSATLSLSQKSPVNVLTGTFTHELPAESIITFTSAPQT